MITGEQVRDAVAKAGITRIDHHACAGCGYMTAYLVDAGHLYFDPGCNCSSYVGGPEPCSWDSAADWINMQSRDDIATQIAAKFGLHTPHRAA